MVPCVRHSNLTAQNIQTYSRFVSTLNKGDFESIEGVIERLHALQFSRNGRPAGRLPGHCRFPGLGTQRVMHYRLGMLWVRDGSEIRAVAAKFAAYFPIFNWGY